MLEISHMHTDALPSAMRDAIVALCTRAYEEDLADYLTWIGPGEHWIGTEDGVLVAHAMVVPRTVYPEGQAPLVSGYVELVATLPEHQGRGHATALLRAIGASLSDVDLGLLSPSDEAFYARLGWERWRGPLAVRVEGRTEPTPDEEIMLLRLPRTPATLDPTLPLAVDWRPGEVW